MAPKRDILKVVDGHVDIILQLIKEETDDKIEGIEMLKSIQSKAESMKEMIRVMMRYRELRKKEVWIYYPEVQKYEEATKTQKIQIARQLIIDFDDRRR